MKFEIGDKVRAFGIDGVVEKADALSDVKVRFINCVHRWFSADGKGEPWHKEPLLKLIERPKKKVKKTVWVGISDKTNGDIHNTSYAYRSAEAAMNYGGFPVYPVEIEVEE